MEFENRKVQFPGKKKLTKVDENNNPIENEEPIYVKLENDEGAIEKVGTPISAYNLNLGNWRDDDSISFKKMEGNAFPDAKMSETQIVTKTNGETWIIPPYGCGVPREVTYPEGSVITVNGVSSNVVFDSDPQIQINEKSTVKVNNVKEDVYFISDPQEQIDNKANQTSLDIVSQTLNNHDADDIRHFTNRDRVKLEEATSMDMIYPVGCVYISVAAVNPSILFGMGTWERFGKGRALVGIDENDSTFAAGHTGGSKEHILELGQMPAHEHTIHGGGGHNHRLPNHKTVGISYSSNGALADFSGSNMNRYVDAVGDHGHGCSRVGGSSPISLLQPYITVYMWVRIS